MSTEKTIGEDGNEMTGWLDAHRVFELLLGQPKSSNTIGLVRPEFSTLPVDLLDIIIMAPSWSLRKASNSTARRPAVN